MAHEYLRTLFAAFEAAADPEAARRMSAYMKGRFDFYGLSAALRRDIQKEHIRTYGLPEADQLENIVTDCWNYGRREMNYFAIEMTDKFLKKNDAIFLDMYEFMASKDPWWDTVDGIASWLLGTTFKRHPEMIRPKTREWMDSGDIWLQRCCLLFQLKYKDQTDTGLLAEYITELAGNQTFWIRKAIGWMLREYSKTNPSWVREFVAKQSLSPLSEKEALRVIKGISQSGKKLKNSPRTT